MSKRPMFIGTLTTSTPRLWRLVNESSVIVPIQIEPASALGVTSKQPERLTPLVNAVFSRVVEFSPPSSGLTP